MSYNTELQGNNADLLAILNTIKTLPDAGESVVLPELTNPGTANDLLSGKQLIDGNGNVVDGNIPTQEAKTVTPTTSEQTAVESGVYTTGAVKVGAIPSTYVQPSGTLEVTENGTHDVKNYASVNVNVASSGGGGSVETCTVHITGFLSVLSYSTVDDSNNIIYNRMIQPYGDEFEINVVCGTSVVLYTTYESKMTLTNATLTTAYGKFMFAFGATAAGGETCSAHFEQII